MGRIALKRRWSSGASLRGGICREPDDTHRNDSESNTDAATRVCIQARRAVFHRQITACKVTGRPVRPQARNAYILSPSREMKKAMLRINGLDACAQRRQKMPDVKCVFLQGE
jgi:hypothetical protein